MATTRMKQSGFGRRRNKISKLLDANEAKDLKQPKVTEFFSTIHRTSSSGVKRLKLQLPNEVDSSKSIDYDVLDSRTSLSIGNVTEKPEEADIAVVHNEGAFDSSGWTTFSTAEHLEDGSERSICSEKREAEPTTPQSVTVAVLPSVSPRIRKTTGAHDASALRCRASRSLFTNSKVGIRDEGATIESRGEMYNSKNIALKASELADIVKHNFEIRNAIKGTIKNSNELYDRLKTMVTPRGNEGHKSIITAEKHAELKSKYTAANSRSSEQPSTSTGAPEFILPLLKPKTPSKQQTPSKSCTSSKSLNQTVVAENNLRSPLKCGRAALLLPEVKNCSSLPLPIKYERLYKLFGHMERVVAILHSQDRRITFDEVSRNVQKNVKCDFTIHHFAQLLSVYPKAFNVRLEEHWAPIGGVRAHETRFDYVIEPNLHDDIIGYMREEGETGAASEVALMPLPPLTPPRSVWRCSPCKKTPVKLQPSVAATDSESKMEAWRITVRAYIFKYRLQDFVKRQHKMFIDKLGVQMKEEELNHLRRYHPDFKLDEVEDIPEAKLPDPPEGDAALPRTMREYMGTVEDSAGTLPQRIKEMINELRSPEKRAALAAGAKATFTSSQGPTDPQKPKGLSLLERIRAKEQAKKRAEMLRDPVAETRKGRLEKLSRSTLRNICSYYAFKKATTVELAELISKLVFSDSSCTKSEMQAQIELLCEVAPEYFTMKSIRGFKYVHTQRNDFKAIHDIVVRAMTAGT